MAVTVVRGETEAQGCFVHGSTFDYRRVVEEDAAGLNAFEHLRDH